MTQHWLSRLYFNKELTTEEFADIPYPRLELHTHVLYKNVQVGLVLGMGVIGPLVGLVRGRSVSAAISSAYKGGKVGVAVFAPLAPVMVEWFIRKQEQERIYDRAFRIRYNEGQMTTDRFATYGGLAGMGASVALGKGILPGAMVGILSSTLFAGLYNSQKRKTKVKTNKEEK